MDNDMDTDITQYPDYMTQLENLVKQATEQDERYLLGQLRIMELNHVRHMESMREQLGYIERALRREE